jgi:alcohol dehydrogenase class IV
VTVPEAWTHTALAQQVLFGPGAVGQLPAVLRTIGSRRALLVTTGGRASSPEGEAIVAALGRSLVSTFTDVASHVPTPVVQQALLQARRDAVDVVVSFGGGACADLGKAVCFFLEQEAGIPGASHLDRPATPHVSIPTTYSGAELTPFFGMTDPATGQKQGAGGPTTAPVAVIYDPELTRSTPLRVRAETGLNALAHCVEAAWSPRRTPVAEAAALAGAAILGRSLPAVVTGEGHDGDPDDPGALAAALEGAFLAGTALQNAGMGVHHGLAQLLGGRTGLPHGLLNAVLLPHSIRCNEPAVPEAVARIGAALGDADDAAGAVDRLLAAVRLPSHLAEIGVDEGELEVVARMAPSNGNVAANPRPLGEADVLALLRDAW